VYSLVNITFETNVENFTINMESTQKNYNFDCEKNNCDFQNISPFEYQVTLESESYKNIIYTWTPSKQTSVQNIEFQKDYQLVKENLLSQNDAEEILQNTLDNEVEETIAEKIQKLKEQSQIHLKIEIENNTYIFKKNISDMSLFKNDDFIGNFEYADKSDILLDEVLWNTNYLSIIINNNKYLFSIQTGKVNKYILEIPLKYIKSTEINGQFIFVTEKGSFVYNLYENIFSYNSYFSDFIYFDKNSFIWIIHKDESEKRSRFEYDNISENTLILQFNPDTKEREILLETPKNITKIFKKDGKIYLEDENKVIFTLSHLEE